MYLERILKLNNLLKKKSFFLFGPRGTGKSKLIDQTLKHQAYVISLLKGQTYLRLADNPSDLEKMVDAAQTSSDVLVVIDEIQKLPLLLDEVHRLIEERKWRFLLTGSSARKLRRGGANLLAGRAWQAELFPFIYKELPEFNLDRYLRYGGLPAVYLSQNPEEDLDAYVNTYLHEEIQAEGLTRNLPQFSRFLMAAASANGTLVNFTAVGQASGISPSTIREYFLILQDTLLGFLVEPWTKSKKRRAIATSKFYLFDCGVTHTLAGTKYLDRNSDLYGKSFEQWLAVELKAFLSYSRLKEDLLFWRSSHNHEVDFLIGDRVGIEVKATRRVVSDDLKGLKALQEESIHKRYYLVSQDEVETVSNNIHCLHWKTFIEKLWEGKITGD